jgi:MFS-type transporter involved in bile tolerance (Atg22 family)
MRYVHVYLIGYFILVLGALGALWYGGVLQQISATWVVIGIVIAAGLGIMLAISAGKPEITRE